jgi:hypothetical protein
MCRQAVTSAVYRNELLAADKEGRICRVPYDASKPVDTFWDLGYFDKVAIWLAQSIVFEFRFGITGMSSTKKAERATQEAGSRSVLARGGRIPHSSGDDTRAGEEERAGESVGRQVSYLPGVEEAIED